MPYPTKTGSRNWHAKGLAHLPELSVTWITNKNVLIWPKLSGRVWKVEYKSLWKEIQDNGNMQKKKELYIPS